MRQKMIAVLCVYALAALPVLVWLFSEPPDRRFRNFFTIFTSLGQASGLLGLSLLSLNFVLSARTGWIDRFFGGLNHAYAVHQQIGKIALLLVIAHPLFLALRMTSFSLSSAFSFLIPSFDQSEKLAGMAALALLAVLVVLSVKYRPRYHVWKLSHKLMGLVLITASLHSFLIPSDISRHNPLKFLMVAFVAAGIAAWLYRSILGGRGKRRFTVESVTPLNQDCWEICLTADRPDFSCQPGQFVFASFLAPCLGRESHPYSAVHCGPKKLVLGIKKLGDYTSKLGCLKPGEKALIEGPFGSFNFKNFGKRQIWIAGGIGITPFVGMAEQAAADPSFAIHLFYQTGTREEAVYAGRLEAIAQKNPSFSFTCHFSKDQGRLSAKEISDRADGGLDGADILICGPGPMMASLKAQFAGLGLPRDRVITEEFQL